MARKVAAPVEHGFEDLELFHPLYRLEEAGYEVEVLTADGRERQGKRGYAAHPAKAIRDARAGDYAALLVAGGTLNADKLRTVPEAVELVREFVRAGAGPVFSICHGPWLLVEADVLRGVTLTSYPSIRKDCENAGATWVDRRVVVDHQFVTSRRPDDLPHFARGMLEALAGTK